MYSSHSTLSQDSYPLLLILFFDFSSLCLITLFLITSLSINQKLLIFIVEKELLVKLTFIIAYQSVDPVVNAVGDFGFELIVTSQY